MGYQETPATRAAVERQKANRRRRLSIKRCSVCRSYEHTAPKCPVADVPTFEAFEAIERQRGRA